MFVTISCFLFALPLFSGWPRCDKDNNSAAAISLKALKGYEIPVPPIKEQREIVDSLSEVVADIERKNILLEKYIELKKSLMSVLLTGKVRV